MDPDEQIIDISFLTLSQKYLHTTRNILEQMIETGNQWMTVRDHDDEKEIWEEYLKDTKWSDFQTIIPTLFLFFHGLELLNKGLLFLVNENNIHKLNLNHNLEELYEKVKKAYGRNSELLNVLKKYSHLNDDTPSIIRDFIKENTEVNNMQDLYESLRYPSTKKLGVATKYMPMKYKEKEGLPFTQELIEDIGILLAQSTKIYRSKKS